MRLWPRRKAATASPAVIESIQEGRANFVNRLGGTNQQVRAAVSRALAGGYGYQYRLSPAVRTVIDVIVRNAAQLDWNLYERSSESERNPVNDHPAALSLRQPNPWMTQDQLIRALLTDYLIYGNAYAQKGGTPGTRAPVSLWPTPAHRVEVWGAGLVPEAYVVHRADGSQTDPRPADEFAHWRNWNPEDPRIGVSPLETLQSVIAEDAANQAAVTELAKTGLSGPIWVFSPLEAPAISDEGRHRAEEDLHNRLQRVNTFPPFMEEGRELRPFGVSPKDAEILSTRKYALQQVAAVYGVPLGMVGLADNVEQAQAEFYADTLPPILRALACELGRAVLLGVYGEPDLYFEADLDEKLMGNERLKALTSGAGVPPLTRNEARARINLPPVPGGDEPITPQNVISGANPKPSVDVMGPQNPTGPEQDGSARQGDPYVRSSGNGNGKAILPGPEDRIPQHLTRRQNAMSRQRRYIGEAEKVFERHLGRQAKRKSLATAKWDEELEADLLPVIRSIFEREGSHTVAELGGAAFDGTLVANYTAAMAREIAKKFNATTQADAAEQTVADAIDRARSERIATAAISVGARAANKAREEAARQAPHAEFRHQVWLADTDRHAALDGVAVPLGSDWGGISPGSEPHCACGLSVE